MLMVICRCNQLANCRDKSDERGCQLLVLEQGYNLKVTIIIFTSILSIIIVTIIIILILTVIVECSYMNIKQGCNPKDFPNL